MMAGEGDLAGRIEALETRLAYQDRAIEEMSTLITDQWREIERLKRRLSQLGDQLAEVEHTARETRSEPPPPHY